MKPILYFDNCEIKIVENNLVLDNIEDIDPDKLPIMRIDNFHLEGEFKVVNCNHKLLRKWLHGSRKNKKKFFGLTKDKRRLLKRVQQTSKLSVADFKRLV